jgi:glycosyltransferase involved in cell wall biosynthesis
VRVAYVLHQFLPSYFSGTEQYVHAIATAMQARGHDVRVFTLEPSFVPVPPFELADDTAGGLPVTRIRFDPEVHANPMRAEYEHPMVGARFGEWLDAVQPDLVHVFHLRYLGANLLDETRRRQLPTVVHLMDFWFLCPRFTLLRADGSLCEGPPEGGLGCLSCTHPEVAEQADALGVRAGLQRLLPLWRGTGFRRGRSVPALYDALVQRPGYLRDRLLQADAIVAPSRFLRAMFIRNGYAEDRIATVSYGIEPLPRVPAVPRTGLLRVGFLGTLASHKGVHVAVEAVRGLPQVELQVHGRTTDFPGYCAPLLAIAGAEPRIRICGPYGRSGLPHVLAGLDLVVVPSLWYENTPFVVLEAQSAGVPVFASDLGGLREQVRDGVDGELFRAGDAADLARRLARAAAEPDRLARYRASSGRVKTMADNVAEMEDLYMRLSRGPVEVP